VGERLQQQIGNGTVVGLRLFGKQDEQRLVLTAVDAGSGETLWTGEARGDGFEWPIEELTWELGEEALADVAPPSITDDDVSRCGTRDQELCRGILSAERAIVEFLPARVARISEALRGEPEAAVVEYLHRHEEFHNTKSPGQSMDPVELPGAPELLSSERRAAWSAIATEARGEKVAPREVCPLQRSPDDFVRFVSLRGMTCAGEKFICHNLTTLADKESCLAESFRRDDNESSMAYFRDFVEQRQAHSVVALGSCYVSMERQVELASLWVERGVLRVGGEHPHAAHALTRLAMFRRDAANALKWGRRTGSAAWREGFALQLAGRLTKGMQRVSIQVREHAEYAFTHSQGFGFMFDGGVRPVVQAFVVLDSPELARQFLENAGESELILSARRLAEVVRDQDRSVCREMDPVLEPFALDVHYDCERWSELVDLARDKAPTGAVERASRFMVADALLNLGQVDEAEKLFATVEKETTFRAVFPVSSLLALERLGRIAEHRGDRDEAREYYAELVRVWGETDIPVPEVEAAREALERLGEKP
jgi:hypothetical protein